MRNGYDENFLVNARLTLPKAGLKLQSDVLISEEFNESGGVIPYIHYSVLMSKFNKQAIYSAANLDQTRGKTVSGRNWFVDTRIKVSEQIDNRAYKRNSWDRGHLTRRTAVTWGDSDYVARKASNDSCAYTNACLQHENFNQDEWRVPEKLVQNFERDKDGRISIFTGPIFTVYDRWYSRRNLVEPVRIPGGFWKLVAYIGKQSGVLECQAYVMFQDSLFNIDKDGEEQVRAQATSYQVTTTELEHWTGLDFPEELFHANPLRFYANNNDLDGPESIRMSEIDENGEPTEGQVFETGDINNANIISRRKSMPEQDFYDFIEEVSWV